MGRPRLNDEVSLDIEKRRNYRRERYYRTRDDLERGYASQAVLELATTLDLKLTPKQTEGMVEYLIAHFKRRVYRTEKI